jgi:hypothetical protein
LGGVRIHFHLPKPLHGWREFAGEVGIIVVGVLIALSAEQWVESRHWHEKLAAAKEGIDLELNTQLDYSEEVMGLSRCAPLFVDALEAAILRHDSGAIGKLHDTQPPFVPRPWRSTAWQSAMSTQVADHFERGELAQYAFMSNSFEDIRRAQESILNDFADATTGRLGAPSDPAATNAQLAAAERLRTGLDLEANIAGTQLQVASGSFAMGPGWKPIPRANMRRVIDAIPAKSRLCEETAKAAMPAAAAG